MRTLPLVRYSRTCGLTVVEALLLVTDISAWLSVPSRCHADEAAPSGARAAVAEIITEPLLAANLRAIQQQAVLLPASERFDVLADWVLPGSSRQSFRFQAELHRSRAESVAATTPLSVNADTQSEAMVEAAVGGRIVSPVLDLLDVAQQTGRLEELAQRVAGTTAKLNADQRSRVSMLAMVAIRAARTNDAAKHLEELYRLVQSAVVMEAASAASASFKQHWPEVLAAEVALSEPVFHEVIRDTLTELEVPTNNYGSEGWANRVVGIIARTKIRPTSAVSTDDAAVTQWQPASKVDAWSRGTGRPAAVWHIQPGEASSVVGHEADYLYFQSPLRGNYEVECDVASTSFEIGHLMVAGDWLKVAGVENVQRGTFRTVGVRMQLPAPLSKLDPWSRYRVVVRDGVRYVFFNGRLLDQQPLAEAHDPWLAIRSYWRNCAAVRDLRITGDAVIPQDVWLLCDPELNNWVPVYSHDRTWSCESAAVGNNRINDATGAIGVVDVRTTLTGRRVDDVPPGCHFESLLSYHRPMLEDGTIEYEFFYQPGEVEVHPAVGRQVFLLASNGVRIHEATDDVWDPAAPDPGNVAAVHQDQLSTNLPLKEGDWNTITLALNGDMVTLSLNGVAIFQHKAVLTGERHFGLFHFADRAAARVRNIVWKGNWPKALPELDQQLLAAPDHECLAGLDDVLTEVVQQRFGGEAVSPEMFKIAGNDVSSAVVVRGDGLQLAPPLSNNWKSVRLEYGPRVFGNFDALLKFDQLKIQPGKGTIGLEWNALEEGTGVVAGCYRNMDGSGRQFASGRLVIPLPDGTRRYQNQRVADESGSGTLRIVRRGRRIHMLIAHGDSNNFRYICSQQVRSAMSAMLFRVIANTVKNGGASVVLKEMIIRSNSAEFERLRDPQVLALDQFTMALPSKQRYDFADSKLHNFTTSNGDFETTDRGLSVRADEPGDASRDAVVAFDLPVTGDFDIAATMETTDATTDSGTTAELSVDIGTKDNGDRSTVLMTRRNQKFLVQGVVVREGASQVVAEIEVPLCDGLRMIRIQKTVFFLYSADGTCQLLKSAAISDEKIEHRGVQLRSHPVGDGQPADVIWTSFEARATGFDG